MSSRPSFIFLLMIPGVIVLLVIGVFLLRKPLPPQWLTTNFGPEQMISIENDGPKRVFAADLNGDGALDVLSISVFDNKLAWYENMDGHGTFGAQQMISTDFVGGDSATAADLDGDGDLDVLSASSGDGKISWYENTNGAGLFGPQQIINPLAPMAYFVVTADFDRDEDLDILYDIWDAKSIAWQKNLDGQATFGSVNIITNQADGASSVFAADLDGDGDTDALSTAAIGNRISWHENIDGYGNFGLPITISSQAKFPTSVFATDLDEDGDLDVLSNSVTDDTVAWYENLDGHGDFGSQKVINNQADQASSVYSADFDGDGDSDVLSGSFGNSPIAWYENDGEGNFGDPQAIIPYEASAFYVIAADVDGDGDPDVIAAAGDADKITWYENLSPLKFYIPIIENSKP